MKYAYCLIQQDIYTQAAFNAEYVQVIFKKINRNIQSTNELNSYYGDRRPIWEKNTICATIIDYIHVSNRMSGQVIVFLINPSTKKPSILLKLVKGALNYTIDEASPYIYKGFGIAASGLGRKALITTEWISYLNKFNNRPDKYLRSSSYIRELSFFGKFNKVAGKALGIAAKNLNRFGTIMTYYEILSVNSPNMITAESIQDETKKQLTRLCNNPLSYR